MPARRWCPEFELVDSVPPGATLSGMSIARVAQRHWGVLRRATLYSSGVPRSAVDAAVDAGELVTVRRGVVALSTARPEVVRAAAVGARISCISAARLRGLWVYDDDSFHVSARSHHSRVDSGKDLEVHWPRRRLDPPVADYVESFLTTLLHVAQCQPLALAVAVFDSAISNELISEDELSALAKGRDDRFAKVAALSRRGAASGLESVMRVQLGLAGITCRIQVLIDGHPVDGLIGRRLVIQVDGFEPHSNAKQRARDLAQDRRLRLMGYSVLRYDYWTVMSGWPRVLDDVLRAMAQGLHR